MFGVWPGLGLNMKAEGTCVDYLEWSRRRDQIEIEKFHLNTLSIKPSNEAEKQCSFSVYLVRLGRNLF